MKSEGSGSNQSNETYNNEKRVTGKGNSRTTWIFFIVFLAIAMVMYFLYNREHKELLSLMETQKNSLTETISARDSVINEWISTFDEIEKNQDFGADLKGSFGRKVKISGDHNLEGDNQDGNSGSGLRNRRAEGKTHPYLCHR